jgi:hypothetical protein
MAEAQKVTELANGPTPVTFHVCMTGTETTDSVFTYHVIAPGAGFLAAAAFGGTLPSGTVFIPAGQNETPFTIDVPQGALGTDPSDNLEVQISDSTGIPIFASTAQTEIVNNQPESGNAAIPLIAKVSGNGTLAFNAATNTYTLALGGLVAGTSLQAVQLAVVNANTFPGDSLGGTFTPPTGTGFVINGNNLSAPIKPGQNYQGLYVGLNNFATGAHTMTMQFAPTDVNDSGYSAALPTITLNITDSITPPAQARLNTPATIIFPNARVGTPETQKISITNTATAPAASLDVTASANAPAVVSGSISQLAPGATDASDMSVGLDTSNAGALSGAVTLSALSDLGGGNTEPIGWEDPYIDVFGTVYRPAAFTVQPSGVSVHVGDAGAQSLIITNTDVNDGYSENLIATVIGATGGVQAHGTTGDIAPESTGSIGLTFSTAMAGLIGTVTLDLKSDGTGIDGLGQIDLGDVTVPVFVTSNNVTAAAQIKKVSGPGTLTQHGSVYTLDLGTINTAPGPINLGVLNTAIAPADTLGGSFSISADSAFTNTGFGAFTGIASGSADTTPTVTFTPTLAGIYGETITLVPVDETGSGNAPLSNETLTITANYQPQLLGQVSLTSATEGTALPDTTTLATFTDTNTGDTSGTFTASINWGDGTTTTSGSVSGGNGNFTVSGGHTYADEGSFPLSVTITDTSNNKTLALSGTVAAVEADVFTPQGITFTTHPGQAFTGTVASFTDTNAANSQSDFSATIDWGDGSTPDTGTITFVNGSILIGGTHTYANAGYDTVTVTLGDDAPGTASASAISTAKVVAQAAGPNPPVITAMADLASSTEAKGTAQAGTTINLYDNGGGTAMRPGSRHRTAPSTFSPPRA